MRTYNRSWRWLIARSLLGVVIALGFAWFFYPHLVGWLVLGALVIAVGLIAALVVIWRRMEPQLRNAGFRW